MFNNLAAPLKQTDPAFDTTDFTKKTQSKDASGQTFFKKTKTNLVSYVILQENIPRVNNNDHSLVEFQIRPEVVGNYMMHVLVGKGKGAVEIKGSPYQVNIVKSDTHKKLQEEKDAREEAKREAKRKKDEEKKRLI